MVIWWAMCEGKQTKNSRRIAHPKRIGRQLRRVKVNNGRARFAMATLVRDGHVRSIQTFSESISITYHMHQRVLVNSAVGSTHTQYLNRVLSPPPCLSLLFSSSSRLHSVSISLSKRVRTKHMRRIDVCVTQHAGWKRVLLTFINRAGLLCRMHPKGRWWSYVPRTTTTRKKDHDRKWTLGKWNYVVEYLRRL